MQETTHMKTTPTNTNTNTNFVVGESYVCRTIWCEWTYTVAERTSHYITFTDGTRCRVYRHAGVEYMRPVNQHNNAAYLLSAAR
jgi:hypothetical protein